MHFVLVMFLKCATCSVVCEILRCCGKKGEAVEKRRGGGGGCCLRAEVHGMGSGNLEECSASR